MQEIGSHPNVVTILGVCTEQGAVNLLKIIQRKNKFFVQTKRVCAPRVCVGVGNVLLMVHA